MKVEILELTGEWEYGEDEQEEQEEEEEEKVGEIISGQAQCPQILG